MFPGVIGCFRPQNIMHPHPDEPGGADQTPTCVLVALPHGILLLNQSHLEAFPAASVLHFMGNHDAQEMVC